MLADFYGKVLVPPTVVEHTRVKMEGMLQLVRQAVREHRLGDVLIAVERTGTYHTPIQRCFRRDLVDKRVALRCQIREHVHLNLPGFTNLFGKHGSQFWNRALPMTVARHFASAAQIVAAGVPDSRNCSSSRGSGFNARRCSAS